MRKFALLLCLMLTVTFVPAQAQQSKPQSVTMEFKHMNVLRVLAHFAKEYKINMQIGQKVKGNIDASLKNVSVPVAIQMIVDGNGLVKVEEDDIMKIMTHTEHNRRQSYSESRKITDELGHPVTTTLELQNASFAHVLPVFMHQIGKKIEIAEGLEPKATVYLYEVPVLDALKALVHSANLKLVEEPEKFKILPLGA